jgi:arylsulfatase A-like enzyme
MRAIVVAILFLLPLVTLQAADVPNILWITCEDSSPMLGCYGDNYATTPNLDALAARGMRYTNANSNAPVCAAARTTIITGVYSPSMGAEHMRSSVPLSPKLTLFPKHLRDAGYYTTNNNKEDYNVEKPGKVWDVSNKQAHWKNRQVGQPFFAVFNYTISHESQIRNEIDKADQIHDPNKVRLPAYHPDTPEVRHDWAQVYDRLTMMDREAGAAMQEVKDAGLADDTIIFFFSDHGSGMPRSKREVCNSGLNVPFIVYFPPKWQHLAPAGYKAGGTSDRLISFVDLAPTVLSLAGIEAPEWMQGGAFCGKFAAPEPDFSFAFRGRMDERYDLVRGVRDKRYMYVRNFMPHLPHGQHNGYEFVTPTTSVWKELFDAGKLNAAQSQFWQSPKAPEELYDLEADHDEVKNVAGDPEQQAQLEKMRTALAGWVRQTKDTGFLPECEMLARSKDTTPYDMGHDPKKYDFDAIFAAANLATSLKPGDLPQIVELLKNDDKGVRYWGAMGVLSQGSAGIAAAHDDLVTALHDDSPIVRVVAAEALGTHGNNSDKAAALEVLVQSVQPEQDAYLAVAAWNAIDHSGKIARPVAQELRAVEPEPQAAPPRYGDYCRHLKQYVLKQFKPE